MKFIIDSICTMINFNRSADDAEYQTGFAEYAKNNTRQLEPFKTVACSLFAEYAEYYFK